MSWFLINVFSLVAAVCLVLWLVAPRVKAATLNASSTAAQGLAAVATAIGIITAGSLYIFERQWSPRFEVGVTADVQANAQVQGAKQTATLQTIVSITNQSRTTQNVGGYEIGVVGIRADANSKADQFGDLPGEVIDDQVNKRTKIISTGETDLAYAETIVPCDWNVVRLVVKVPQPPFTILTPPDKRTLYQRKLLVSTKPACQ